MKKFLYSGLALAFMGVVAFAVTGTETQWQDSGFNILKLKVGDGTPGTATGDNDAYVEGDLEVDATLNVAGASTLTGNVTISGTIIDTIQVSYPIVGQCKVGATAGWVITAGTNISHATLPASQTNSTLVCPLPGMPVGSTVTAVALAGQVESAGGTVTATLSVRKLTNAAADNTDAEIANDTLGAGVTADTILSASNLGVTGQSEVIAADESLYVLVTATTAASTDIDATHLLVTYTSG